MRKTILILAISLLSMNIFAQPAQYVAEPVDLGLSVRWATCNIGAFLPEQFGTYFAWGELAAKQKYDWSTYIFANDKRGKTFKQYNDSDKVTLLQPDNDAASVIMEKEPTAWRIPTADEWMELCTRCRWEFCALNGVNGYKITGPNNNTIFLPASDEPVGKSKKKREMTACYYWSANLSQKIEEAILFFAPDNRPAPQKGGGVTGSAVHVGLSVGPFLIGHTSSQAQPEQQQPQQPANITTVAKLMSEKRCYATPIRPVCPK